VSATLGTRGTLIRLCAIRFLGGSGLETLRHFSELIAEEVIGPIFYVSKQVRPEGLQKCPLVSEFAPIQGDSVRGNRLFSNARLESSQEMFRVAFDDQLDRSVFAVLPRLDRFYEQVGKSHLYGRVQVDLRLFQQDRRIGLRVETLHDNGKDL
jgi:hypothetical protein